jgi:predicted metal-dependent phosphotriesterase family hydrolase
MPKPRITTVLGDIAPGELGPALAHEHLYCDISPHSKRPDNRVQDTGLIASELDFFRQAGGRSVVELTVDGIGRDAPKLREISERSGTTIISGIAFYQEECYPEWVRRSNPQQIADYLIRHLEVGDQGVRAGLIGELTSHNEPEPNAANYQLRDVERNVFVGAARAQIATGVAISTHASLGRAGHAQLNLLEKEGVDLRRVAIGHCDTHWHHDPDRDLEYYLPILERGAFCEFDLIGWSELMPDEVRAERIAALVRLGYSRKILLSTDTCRLSQMHRNGGRGFDYLWTSFLPRLRQLGVTDAEINSMIVDAPRELLTRP